MSKFLYLWLFFFVSLLPSMGNDDFQLWGAFTKKLYTADNYKFDFYGETRVGDDGQKAFGYFFGPRFQYTGHRFLMLGLAAKFIHFKSGDSGFAKTQRFEGEAGLKFNFLKVWNFQNRNRFEYFRRENRADKTRIRSRLKFTRRTKGLAIDKIFMSNELFYEPKISEFTENRFVPFGAVFKVTRGVSMDVYYMWEHIRANSQENHILGTTIYF